MANPKHVALVRKGWEAIEKWRLAHPDAQLDVGEADLSGADLSWADLSDANLSGANLGEANLSRANLSNADLVRSNLNKANLSRADLSRANLTKADVSGALLWQARLFGATLNEANLGGADLMTANLLGADLRSAHLRDADLTGANLWRANLSEANLSGADLTAANFTWANLGGADLSRASLRSTSLGDVDLSRARGLATVSQESPSSVGVDTLIASFRGAGNRLTPELRAFFRGAGVPEELLDALPAIVGEVKYYSCFISYGQPDVEFAEMLTKDLRARGVPCWLWQRDKTVGKPTWGEIEQKLDEYDRMVVVCSIKALIRDGFKKEIDKQMDKNQDKLMPVSLDGEWTQDGFKAEWASRDLKAFLVERNYADFANKSHEEAVEELLRSLKRPEVKKPRRGKKPS